MQRTVVALALTLVLGGCFEMEAKITIEADGSGRQELRLGMTDSAAKALRRSAIALGASGTHSDPMDIYERSKAQALLESQGMVLSDYRTYRERRREFVEIVAEFSSVAQLKSGGILGADAEWYLLPGRNPGGLRLLMFPRGHAAWLAAVEQARVLRAKKHLDPVESQFFRRQKAQMAGLAASLRIELPGSIDYHSANMVKDGDRAVLAELDPGVINSPADLVMALAPRYEVEFDGRGCSMPLDTKEPELPNAQKR